MKILMLTWEFPPLIAGGLGMACYGIVKSLLKLDVEIDLIMPTKQTAYFPLRKPEDADLLPVVFLDEPLENSFKDKKCLTKEMRVEIKDSVYKVNNLSIEEKLEYLGLSETPETYLNMREQKLFKSLFTVLNHEEYYTRRTKTFKTAMKYSLNNNYAPETGDLLKMLANSLAGEEDIFKKIQEFTVKATKIARINIDYDLIHAHDWLTYSAGMFIKNISGKPLISHIHATEFDRAGGVGDERVHHIEYSGMSYADVVIAVSKYTAQMIINRYRIYTEKIRINYNAHYSNVIDKSSNSRRLLQGPTILFLGRITIQKGPDYFLDVAKKVLDKHPQAYFIMAGTGDMARQLLHKSASYGLKNRFLFAGFLNRKEVELILSNTDIYMLPSISEPFGIAPLEAMAYGITAIISKQSGVSEIVDNAFKIDYWDIDEMSQTINYLIENPQQRIEIGLKGRKEVEKIRWDDVAASIKRVYGELTSNFNLQQ